ncbi:toll/interleukin-1 receptor domain-containing protein [uncultured Methanobacterium sp.]|uniref:toll/interleukin-1 receptor domain-containing protein n=1 Tax=uncultured Methanobacterium sp. TaxID=176306 RepID=UPI002AA60B44|nr:toll/interleukin-1 receptor domain-containing protein [uncultured Methanobacterium sp.]
MVKLFVGMAALIPYPVTANYVNSNFSIGSEYSIFVNIFLFILPFLLYVFYMIGISANYVNKEPNSPEPETVPFNENFDDSERSGYDNNFNSKIPTYDRVDGNFFEKEPVTPANYQAKINNNSKKPLVFISHSSEDKIVANAVLAKLEQEKIRCWISYRDILPSLGYGKSIIDAINKSSLMVLIFSKNSHNSDQVLREVERAVSKGVPILPLRIEDILPEGDMEYFLSAVNWLDAFEPPLDKHIQILTEKIKVLLEIEKEQE